MIKTTYLSDESAVALLAAGNGIDNGAPFARLHAKDHSERFVLDVSARKVSFMAVRSEQSHKAILEATMELLDESGPDALTVQKLSIERIARQAGVSKTTIYRWWPSKAAVVIDTFLENHVARTPVRGDIPAIEALREHLASVATIYAGSEGRLISQLIAECQYDPATMAEFKERFWVARSQAATSLIRRAVEEGALRDDLDLMVMTELLYSPLYFRLLLQSGPLDGEAAKTIFDAALEGLAKRA